MISRKNTLMLAISFATVAFFFIYIGIFSTPKVDKASAGPYHMLYIEHTGSYAEFNDSMKKVQNLVATKKIVKIIPFGIYFDDPKVVAEENMRSWVGILIDKSEIAEVQDLVNKKVLKLKTIAKQDYARTTFPFKNMVSIYMGIFKVYPALEEFSTRHNFPQFVYKKTGYEKYYIMEIYRKDAGYIEYLMVYP